MPLFRKKTPVIDARQLTDPVMLEEVRGWLTENGIPSISPKNSDHISVGHYVNEATGVLVLRLPNKLILHADWGDWVARNMDDDSFTVITSTYFTPERFEQVL